MNDFTLADLGVFIGVMGGVLTSLLLTIQKSKCKTVSCCGASCSRELKPVTTAVEGETEAGIRRNASADNP
jgi:ABC-type transporter Mla maintaining outer membrane lipid asymmetry permease subunit MlaE